MNGSGILLLDEIETFFTRTHPHHHPRSHLLPKHLFTPFYAQVPSQLPLPLPPNFLSLFLLLHSIGHHNRIYLILTAKDITDSNTTTTPSRPMKTQKRPTYLCNFVQSMCKGSHNNPRNSVMPNMDSPPIWLLSLHQFCYQILLLSLPTNDQLFYFLL